MKQTLKDICIILTRAEKIKGCWLAIADLVISVLDIVSLLALVYIINFYTQLPAGKQLFSAPFIQEHPLFLIAAFFLFFALKNTAAFILSTSQYRFVYTVATRLSCQNMLQYLNGSYRDYVQVDSSVHNRRISQEPIEFCQYVLNGVQQLFGQLLLIVITIAALLIFNPLLFPLLLLILIPPVLLVVFLMKRKLEMARQHGKQTSEKTLQHLQEALAGFIESSVYQKDDFFTRRYIGFQQQLNHYLSTRLIIQSLPPRLIEVFAVLGLLTLVAINFMMAPGHSLQLITIGALMVAAYKIIPGIVKITNIAAQVKSYSFTAADLALAASPTPPKLPAAGAIQSAAFKEVYFSFKDKPVLASLSFNLKRGDFAVISGSSGKGKTTLVNLLLGFLEQGAGNIYINGMLTGTQERQQYWPAINYVKQQAFFLHGSIRQNISLQESNFDAVKIAAVAAVTGVDAMAAAMPAGLNTIITENGKNISGGQRQRISFARALYRDFDLLLMDEPFNELDAASEEIMLQHLQQMAATGKIILLVTHNETALSFCNKKIVVDESR